MKPLQSDLEKQPRRADQVLPVAKRFLRGLRIQWPTHWVLAAVMLALAVGGQGLWGAKVYAQGGRTVRVGAGTGTAGLTVSVPVELVSQGNENALGFSLNFDATRLTNPQVANGTDASGASVNPNTSQAAQGRLGIALALPASQSFAAGTRQLIVITFSISGAAQTGMTPITFSDQPIRGEVVSPTVEDLTAGTTFTPGAITINPGIVNVSAASFKQEAVAPESIVAAYGVNLATSTASATTIPLPTTLAGTTVKVNNLDAPLFYASPGQVNYLIPAGTAPGAATVTITNGDNVATPGSIQIAAVAPGIFTANSNGQGVPVALAFRDLGGGMTATETVFDLTPSGYVPRPIDLGPETTSVFLILFGTGFRGASALSAVTATIGGTSAPVGFFGPAPGFVGLDQANVRIPRSLIGRGDVEVILTVDGKAANTVLVNIK